MALKDFDWKQFLLLKGEKLGLGLAAVLMVVLIVLSLFMPGHGFFSGNANANAEELNKLISDVERALVSAEPTDADKPPPIDNARLNVTQDLIVDRGKYQLNELFLPRQLGDDKRKLPELLQPDDGYAAVALAQLKTYIFNADYTKLMVLKDGKGGAGGGPAAAGKGKAVAGASPNLRDIRNRIGKAGQAAGKLGNVRDNRLMKPQDNIAGETKKPDADQEFVDIAKLGTDASNARLAEAVRPLRLALIAASFPYKAQIEEFQRKLRLASPADVLAETSMDTTPEGQPLPAFRFLGVRVQRRELNSEGKPVTAWQSLDLERTYKPYVILSGKRFDQDDENLELISFPGLVMPKLPQFQADQYPPVEKNVKNLEATVTKLTEKPPTAVVTPGGLFGVDEFDIFSGSGAAANPAGMPGMAGGPAIAMGPMGPMGRRPRAISGDVFRKGGPAMAGGVGPMAKANPAAAGAGLANLLAELSSSEGALPDHCLVRLIDVTIVPGKTYQYRLQVRMANPNYGRKDVAAPNYATEKELVSDNWFEVPSKVVVPPEQFYYAVDQKKLEPRDYKGPFDRHQIDKDRQIAVQIHRWIENAAQRGGGFMPVGEWSIAERIPVYRGEYVGRTVDVELPIWKYTQEQFILAETPGTRGRTKRTYPIDFSLAGIDAILVDFEGGDGLVYQRVVRRGDERPETTLFRDDASVEALILSPEGKLLSRDSAADAADPDRVARLDKWRKRVEDVREGKSADDAPGGAASPFAK